MPSVSVIVPVYGVEQYIARCARSLFGQTLQDIEFIFIDDCSPDRSIEIMREILETEFPTRKSQVKVFRMPQNSGQAQVRMQGISMATGDYVIHCDSDDEVAPFAYQMMYEKAVVGNYDMVICDFFQVKDGNRISRSQFSESGEAVDDVLTGKVMGALWCRMFRRSLLEGVEAAVASMTEDLVITLQILCKAKSVGYVREPLYYYYLSDSSITFVIGKDKDVARWKGCFANSRLVVDLMTRHYGFDSNYPPLIYYKYRTRFYLRNYTHIPEYYHHWRNTYPEVDRVLLFTSGIPIKEKFWFLLIHLHLYHPWKTATKAIRKGFNGLLK